MYGSKVERRWVSCAKAARTLASAEPVQAHGVASTASVSAEGLSVPSRGRKVLLYICLHSHGRESTMLFSKPTTSEYSLFKHIRNIYKIDLLLG